jgi:hypothetical protein
MQVFHIPCTLQQDYIVSAPLYFPSLKIWLVGWLVGWLLVGGVNSNGKQRTVSTEIQAVYARTE